MMVNGEQRAANGEWRTANGVSMTPRRLPMLRVADNGSARSARSARFSDKEADALNWLGKVFGKKDDLIIRAMNL